MKGAMQETQEKAHIERGDQSTAAGTLQNITTTLGTFLDTVLVELSFFYNLN